MGPQQYSNPSFEQQTGQVPVNDPGVSGRNNSSANPVLDALSEAVRHAQGQVEQANKQVSDTPMYSQHSGGQPVMPVPSNVPFQHSSVQNLAGEHPQTRAGARNKAVGQIAAQAGNIVGKYIQKKEAEKTQNLAQDIHRSMELNQGIDEANQILQQNPNDSTAKAQLQKNQTLLKALLDGKNGTKIAKAYDITFGAKAQEEKEKNAKAPEKQAMQAAMKQVQEDNRLKQFQDQLPKTMDPNPAYEAAQKNALAIQKQADQLTKTYTTMATSVFKEQGANQRTADTNASRENVADKNAASRIGVQQTKDADAFKLNQQKHQEKMQQIGAQGAQRMAQIKEVKKGGDNLKGQKMAEDFAKSLDGTMGKVRDGISKIDIELNKPENKQSENSEGRKALMAQKEMLGSTLKGLQEQKDQAIMEMHSDPDAAAMYNLIGKDEEQ